MGEELRQQAKQTLLEATSSGKLDEALSNIKGDKSPEAGGAEALRQQAKQTLVAATADGSLDAALSKVKEDKDAAAAGAPAASGDAPKEPEKPAAKEETDTEVLRKQAKDTLLAATANGS